jgi:hypothetical protein
MLKSSHCAEEQEWVTAQNNNWLSLGILELSYHAERWQWAVAPNNETALGPNTDGAGTWFCKFLSYSVVTLTEAETRRTFNVNLESAILN